MISNISDKVLLVNHTPALQIVFPFCTLDYLVFIDKYILIMDLERNKNSNKGEIFRQYLLNKTQMKFA